jgi:hypothetical protein
MDEEPDVSTRQAHTAHETATARDRASRYAERRPLADGIGQ